MNEGILKKQVGLAHIGDFGGIPCWLNRSHYIARGTRLGKTEQSACWITYKEMVDSWHDKCI